MMQIHERGANDLLFKHQNILRSRQITLLYGKAHQKKNIPMPIMKCSLFPPAGATEEANFTRI
jgi:hypothetical protein